MAFQTINFLTCSSTSEINHRCEKCVCAIKLIMCVFVIKTDKLHNIASKTTSHTKWPPSLPGSAVTHIHLLYDVYVDTMVTHLPHNIPSRHACVQKLVCVCLLS